MPGRKIQQAAPGFCRRCETNEATITIRGEPLCQSCFIAYVSTKVVKRMEVFKIRNHPDTPQRKFLLPLSLGVSSVSMLHVLDQHIERQVQRSTRAVYQLHVILVDMSLDGAEAGPVNELEAIKERYPRHSYSTTHVVDVIREPELQEIFGSLETSDSEVQSDHLKVQTLLASATSPTARMDILNSLRAKTIIAAARLNDCESILWGDSTTRLAEKTLSETAKGRGFALPWIAAEGEIRQGIRSQYPMRDLLKKELVSFADTTEPPLTPLIAKEVVKPAVSAKNNTIDDLTTQYFQSVERDYPSIVANVVRTTAKLELPTTEGASICKLCDIPITESKTGNDETRQALCSNCARSLGTSN